MGLQVDLHPRRDEQWRKSEPYDRIQPHRRRIHRRDGKARPVEQTEKPVHLIILVAAGERQHKEYLRLLSNIMGVLKDKNVREKIIEAESSSEIIDIFKEQKAR